MNIRDDDGRSNNNIRGNFGFCKLFAVVLIFGSVPEACTLRLEWNLVSPYELSQQNNWKTVQGADTANIDLSKGGQVAFVPAPLLGYGLYNRPYSASPRVINLNLGKPKHSNECSSEEHHKHKRKRHRDDSSDDHEHEYHKKHHHESPKEMLNHEHAEQAEVSQQMAGALGQLIQYKKSQLAEHAKMRDQELEQGNEEAARKEQIIINTLEKQISLLEGIEKTEEAIMAGEVEMYYDDDGAGHKHKHHGGDHHHGDDHHHGHDSNEDHHQHHPHHGHDSDEDHHQHHPKHEHHNKNAEEPYHNHEYEADDDDGDDHEEYENQDQDDHDGNDEGLDHHDEGNDDAHEEGHGNHEDEGDDTKNDPNYDPGNEHHVERRSPFVSSFIPSLSPTTTDPKTATAKADSTAEVAIDILPSATPYSNEPSPKVDANVNTNAVASTTTTSSNASSTSTSSANSQSGWFSWFGSSNDTPTYSPYTLLQYLSPTDKSQDNLMSMFNVFSDPSNNSYLSNASTVMRIVMFFMPGTGIVDQVQFTMAMSKIMWEAASMYYEGYGTSSIAVVVLGDLVEAAYLTRRDEGSIIQKKILTSGETVNIDGWEVPTFMKYVKNMKYPDLSHNQEQKLQTDIDNLVTMNFPNISPELKATFVGGLKDTTKFLSLLNVQGDLHVDNVDVNFSEVYIKMHSAFEDSALEKIKKSILSAIDSIKAKFN